MADILGIDAAVAIELLFKREDDESFVHVLAEKFDAALPPCPELRSYVIHDRNATLLHLAGNTPVEGGRVNDDGQVGFAAIGFVDQSMKEPPDFGKMTEDFGYANDCEVFGIDNCVAPRGAH